MRLQKEIKGDKKILKKHQRFLTHCKKTAKTVWRFFYENFS
jgi:hypothetical protein